MGFKDYIAVLDSDVYEYSGTAKSILSRIAHLIIEPNREDPVTGKQIGEPKANVGFCVASQDYIACQLGLSVSKVWKATKLFKKDGWLDIVKTRDRYGDHNKYQWAEGAWDRLAARKREETEQGEYVRTKQVLMERWPKQGRFARDKDAGNQLVGEGIEATHPFEDTPLREERSPHRSRSDGGFLEHDPSAIACGSGCVRTDAARRTATANTTAGRSPADIRAPHNDCEHPTPWGRSCQSKSCIQIVHAVAHEVPRSNTC